MIKKTDASYINVKEAKNSLVKEILVIRVKVINPNKLLFLL